MSLPSPMARVLVLPKFGRLTDDIVEIVSAADPNTLYTYVYSESSYERKLARRPTQVLRSLVHLLPSVSMKRLAERLIVKVRYRSNEMAVDLLEFCEGVHADHLIIVKPALLGPEEFARIRKRLGVQLTTIVLWDAMWRTPLVEALLPQAEAAFTTEPADVVRFPSLAELPVPRSQANSVVQCTGDERVSPAFFGCASWSLDRFLAARKFVAAASCADIGFCVHLVTDRPLLKLLNRLSGIESDRLDVEENRRMVGGCEVHVDFGRRGQTSPSERLTDSAIAGVLLLTQNPWLAGAGYPVVDGRKSWVSGVVAAKALIGRETKHERANTWQDRSDLAPYLMSGSQWFEMLTSAEKNQSVELELEAV